MTYGLEAAVKYYCKSSFMCAAPPAKKSVGLIEKETDEHRTSNVQHRTSNECILSVIKKISRSLLLVGVAAPTPRRAIPSFVIRYSAVRCLARLPN